MEKNQIKNALLIDGSAIVHRAYHALPSFTSSDGTPTNALYGFITMFLGMIDMFRPSYLAVCLDTPKPTFRKKILSTYQAQRPKAPDNLSRQFPLVIEFDALGLFEEGAEKPTPEEFLGSMRSVDYNSYIEAYVWSSEPEGSVFVDTQSIEFKARAEQRR